MGQNKIKEIKIEWDLKGREEQAGLETFQTKEREREMFRWICTASYESWG